MNKGKESNAYLTYILDNYEHLAEVVVFLHAHRKGWPTGWHTDNPDHDNVNSVQTLRLESVQKDGYVNLRCNHVPGCPDEVQPFRNPRDNNRSAEHAFPEAWRYMFGDAKIPDVVGVPCCAQFAVSKRQILVRPKKDYQRYMRWLIETKLDDDTSGRIFEYLWHIMFGQEAVL